jgi:predicted nuclease of predicted toxin-antitoxin system
VRVRFHLDERVPFAVATGLRLRKIDVTCSNEAGLDGASDEVQLEFALADQRVLVTRDADFLRLHRSGKTHCGIAYCRQGSVSVGKFIRRLILIHDLMEAKELLNRIEFL